MKNVSKKEEDCDETRNNSKSLGEDAKAFQEKNRSGLGEKVHGFWVGFGNDCRNAKRLWFAGQERQ